MIPLHFLKLGEFEFNLIGMFVAAFFGLFLFWRAGKHELYDEREIFDSFAAFAAGFLVSGRLVDFLVRLDVYRWSLRRLIFFNAYGGFDVYGAMVGGMLFAWIYIRQKHKNVWKILDLGASPLAFSATIYLLFKVILRLFTINKGFLANLQAVIVFFGYFVVFCALKRFETKKKHDGFFISFFVIGVSVVNMLSVLMAGRGGVGIYSTYFVGANAIVIVVFGISWYLLLRRNIFVDVKSLLGATILSVFKLKRVITNLREADNTAKSIILSPLALAKIVGHLVKYLSCEFVASIVDLGRAFGIHR